MTRCSTERARCVRTGSVSSRRSLRWRPKNINIGSSRRRAWCDSEYTFSGGKAFTQDEVIAQVEALAPCKLVEFTGGEPMLQAKELLPLMEALLGRGYTLMMETSGERPLEAVPKAVHKIVDVKCPGAGSAAGVFGWRTSQR